MEKTPGIFYTVPKTTFSFGSAPEVYNPEPGNKLTLLWTPSRQVHPEHPEPASTFHLRNLFPECHETHSNQILGNFMVILGVFSYAHNNPGKSKMRSTAD